MKTVLLAFVLFLAVVFVLSRYSFNDEPTPCSTQGFPARCYNVIEDTCNIIWQKAVTDCDDYLKKLPIRPGQLIGPIEKKCRLANFDKAFLYSRKSTAECSPIFEDLERWKKRNDFQ